MLTLRAYDACGVEVWSETAKNLVVNSGYAMILENLMDGGWGVKKVAIGTNGTPPMLTDEAIADPVLLDITTIEKPAPGVVRYNFRIGYEDAVGMSIREFGLLGMGHRLFSRRTRACIEKDANIAIVGTWDIHIGVEVGEVAVGDTFRFSVTVPKGVDVGAVNLAAAPLKFDKHFAFTYTTEASTVGAYARIFRRINHKWIDDKENFHMDGTPGTGYIPEQALVMGDGCGKSRRFGFSCAIQPTGGDEKNPDGFIRQASTSEDNPFITWLELRMLADFGAAPCFYRIDDRIHNESSPAAIVEGLTADDARSYSKIGRRLKTLVQPTDNPAYIEAAATSPLVAFTRSVMGDAENRIIPATSNSLYKRRTCGGECTSDIVVKLAELAVQRVSDTPYWVGMASGQPGGEQMLEQIYNLYGKGGDDSLWLASWDEVYEYITMREGLVVKKSVEGLVISFEVYVPANRAFQFRDITLLVEGIPSTDGVSVNPASNNIKGLTFAAHAARWSGTAGLMVNVNFNTNAVALAEKYTAQYEASADVFDREDAEYFTSLLLPSLASPFIARIEAVVPSRLQILGVEINDGAATILHQDVTLTISKSGIPTHYRASESPDFAGAEWISYIADTVPFALSAEDGRKRVCVQLKDATNQTGIVSISVMKIEPVRAILSFGWEDTPESNTAYDPVMKVCKVGNVDNNGVITSNQGVIYDVHGDIIGMVLTHDMNSRHNNAKTTGNNSGIYPDEVLKRSISGAAGAYATPMIEIRLFMNKRVRVKLFVNYPSIVNSGWGCYLNSASGNISFPLTNYNVINNFTTALSVETDAKHGNLMTLRTIAGTGRFHITAIEIEEA